MSVRLEQPRRAPSRAPRPTPHVVPAPGRAKPRRASRPRLRIVRRPSHRRLPFVLISLVVVGVLIAAVAGVQALVSQSSFRMDDLSRRIEQLQDRQAELQLQDAELSSPKGIARAAKRLGLELPGPPVVLTVPNEQRPPQEPAGGSSP